MTLPQRLPGTLTALDGLVHDQDDSTLWGEAHAWFSPDRVYRYALTRTWGPDRWPHAVFLMLNPSTADAFTLDNTVSRCAGHARRWGCGGLIVVNLFAFRSPRPPVMRAYHEPVGGSRNDDVIRQVAALDGATPLVAAWGVHGTHLGRAAHVTALLRADGRTLNHLGTVTKDGHPRHPLYSPSNSELHPYTER